MDKPFTGGCACGAVRYSVPSQPLALFDCQCRRCQHESGTGHTSHLTFKAEGVERSGEVLSWQTRGDGGTLKERSVCKLCGCPVSLTFPDIPDYFLVPAGSLDEPSRFEPQFVTWASKGQKWDLHAEGITKFDQMPPPTA